MIEWISELDQAFFHELHGVLLPVCFPFDRKVSVKRRLGLKSMKSRSD
jgi:hypothetical protein